jgi:hypothetical protein
MENKKLKKRGKQIYRQEGESRTKKNSLLFPVFSLFSLVHPPIIPVSLEGSFKYVGVLVWLLMYQNHAMKSWFGALCMQEKTCGLLEFALSAGKSSSVWKDL